MPRFIPYHPPRDFSRPAGHSTPGVINVVWCPLITEINTLRMIGASVSNHPTDTHKHMHTHLHSHLFSTEELADWTPALKPWIYE